MNKLEGGGMDIQKELLAYEQSLQDNGFFKVENIGMCTVFDPEQNKYHPSDLCDPKEYKFIDMLNIGWTAWQAAKANAVPEKDVVIKKLSDQLYAQEMKASAARVLCETACELLDDYAHQDAMVILDDLEQAMKEPAND